MTISNKYDKNSPIGFFDSGVGGLTVLSKLQDILPNEKYIYYGDTLNMPYGEKTKEELIKYSRNILNFFEEQNCKAVVMACNTTSSTVYEDLKNDFSFKLFPIVQSVSEILAKLPIKSIGVFATRATINSGAYRKGISKYNADMEIFEQFCPEWVHIVEENSIKTEQSRKIIKSDLDRMLKLKPEKIVLGCTHYPFLMDVLSEEVSSDMFIDPAKSFAEFIKNSLSENKLIADDGITSRKFYVSKNPQQFKVSAKMFYDLTQEVEIKTFS